jgi:WD40 repeat protein/class 3 adenylate cyclase/tRNA A-37 threonylcarbamoyl transferase component Bud32/energy-coupling factor transporter ATP-binding protein EcfA2
MCADPSRGKPVLTLFRERYEVLATVGSGGEAQIVKALDRQHGRFVALKIRPVRDEAAREDLLGEARLLLSLPPHPALPLVREDFFDRDDYVVAMDWVDGTDLATLLDDRGRPGLAPSSVLAYLAQAAEALTHLHSQSPPVIHGDVKPGNLILSKGGRIKLVDFGLSSAPYVPRVRAGTPGYRAPELAAGGTPSRASDVYALAATAFALLTGSAPAGVLPAWEGFDPAQAQQLEAAIRLGMATDPGRRPKTPGELVERLRAGWSAALPTGVVTFCCSDIEGSSALWESDPEAMAAALVRHDELIADAVEARGGSLIRSMGEGDSTVSVFDSAPAAVEAALAANRTLAAEEWPPRTRIAARWGIHTGEAERRDADYYGPSVNLAAHVRAQADGGEILLSSVTSELVAAHLPESCSLVDLGQHRLKGTGTPERIFALAGPGVRTPPVTDCPYRGLLSFEAGDERFFFGREAVVADLVARVAGGELLAVVGASGSGKSSVLRAGLVAAARAGRIPGVDDAVVVTPGAEAVLGVPDQPETLLVVDQFEELFVLCDGAARRAAFVDALLARRGRVAIGLRADVYGRLGAHADLAAAVAANQVLLGAMTDDELARAVAEPARLAGLRLEPGLVELILRDVAAEPGALPLLSHALRATWERRDGRTLTVEGYRASGGVTSAIARTADDVIDGLPADGRALARSVFLRMTELGEGTVDSRRRVASDELVPEGATSPDGINALLERLAEARLVTLSDGSAEVAHEALIREWPRLRRWLEEDRAGIRAHRQLGDAARLWDAGGRETSDLYRGARLAGATELAQSGRAELNAPERAFLDAGVAEDQRERRAERRTNRRLRGLLAGAAVLLVLAVGAGILSVTQRNRAEAQALRSDAERIGALAQTAEDLGQSMLYGVAAVELEDRVQTRGQLLATLQRNPGLLITRKLSPVEVAGAAISPDGRLLASGDRAGVVRFTDLRTWKPSGPSLRLGRPVPEQAMAFSPDGRAVAVGAGSGNRMDMHFVDVATRRARRVRSWRGWVTPFDLQLLLLAYAPGGRHLAVALATYGETSVWPIRQRLALLDARSGRTIWERALSKREQQREVHVGFTPNGTLITSAEGGETIAWDAREGRILRRYPVGGKLSIAPDGERVALAQNGPDNGDPSSSVGMLNLRTGEHRTLADNLPSNQIDGLAFNHDGTRVIGGTHDGTHVWDVKTGNILETFNAPRRRFRHGVVLDPQGRALLGAGDGAVSLWDPDGGRRLGRRFFWGPTDNGCYENPCSVIDPHGELMATSQGDGTTALVNLRTKRLARTLPARDGDRADGLSFSPDGRRLATGGTAGSVTIWDPASGAVLDRLRYADPVLWTTISPDGRLLATQRQATGAADSTVEVRELASGRPLFSRTVRFGAGEMQFSRDSRVLFASGCCEQGSTVAAWDARTGAERFERHPPGQARPLALAPDSQTLLVATQDGAVHTWDARTGRERAPAIKVTSAAVLQLAVSPDGRLLATSDWAAHATLWDLRTHERVGDHFPEVPGLIPQVAFEPNGRLLITELGSASEWPVDRPTLQRFACRVAGRSLSRDEWRAVLPNQPYRRVCG